MKNVGTTENCDTKFFCLNIKINILQLLPGTDTTFFCCNYKHIFL